MRLIKMTGGLGNQMFIYAMYLCMRERFPNTRIDLSDMQHYHAHNGYELHEVFHLPHNEFCIPQALKKVMEFCFFKIILERKQNLETLAAYTQPHHWPLLYFKGFYQSERFFKDHEDLVRHAFTFDPSKANTQTQAMARAIQEDAHAVSLHVRRGDYQQAKFIDNLGKVCGLPYYERAIEKMKALDSEARFYVFSDDTAWCRANIPLKDAVFIDWNTGKDSWQDMLLMSLCHHNIICNSTFSWWGAWLNRHKDKVVLTPDRWSAKYDTPYINCPSWTPVPTVAE